MGFDTASVYFVLEPLWVSTSTTVWPFDATEVIVDYSPLSASIFICASHGTGGGSAEGAEVGEGGWKRAQAAIYICTNFPL